MAAQAEARSGRVSQGVRSHEWVSPQTRAAQWKNSPIGRAQTAVTEFIHNHDALEHFVTGVGLVGLSFVEMYGNAYIATASAIKRLPDVAKSHQGAHIIALPMSEQPVRDASTRNLPLFYGRTAAIATEGAVILGHMVPSVAEQVAQTVNGRVDAIASTFAPMAHAWIALSQTLVK